MYVANSAKVSSVRGFCSGVDAAGVSVGSETAGVRGTVVGTAVAGGLDVGVAVAAGFDVGDSVAVAASLPQATSKNMPAKMIPNITDGNLIM
jgi:hypothetical protein